MSKKKYILLLSILIIALFACNQERAKKLSLDKLVNGAEQFEGKRIETEGMAVHFCGAGKKKLKLKSEEGLVVKVIPSNLLLHFSAKYNHKKLKIAGRVDIERVERSFIDQVNSEKTLLCHIDHTPCIDEEWVKRKQETGVADSLSSVEVKSLRDKMQKSGKDYITVVTILADEIEIIKD
ncbi:hypothetical protein [Marinifilum flexuosum]|uniref:hypothetical protein n=1 Tax=Marinifilum flexuosum TaxID=1117708 RepID=UPI002493CA73|nr:hypothetical protein [Marinifilum flexuosum]